MKGGSTASVFGIALIAMSGLGAMSVGSASAAPCPNEALRVGPSAALPECRAYEMVSPPDKGDGSVDRQFPYESAPGGNRVAFISTSAFGGAEANPAHSFYLAKRDDVGGWSAASVDPPSVNPGATFEVASTALSEDLGETLQASSIALTPGAIEGGSNVYVRDNQSGARALIKSAAGNELFYSFAGFLVTPYVGGSPNWSHLILS